jgi:hypothetical protein
MPFNFAPGQQPANPQASQSEAPALVVPTVPNIANAGNALVAEKLSPFAYKNRSKSKFGIYFQSVIFLAFGIALFTAIGLFVYVQILSGQIERKKAELAAKEANFPKFKPGEVDEIIKLADRVKFVNKLINEQASVRTAFKMVESSVNDDVVYTKFSLSRSKTKKGFDIAFDGQTNGYYALYKQVEALKSKTFSDIFSNVQISGADAIDTRKGVASFKFVAMTNLDGIDPDTFTVTKKDTASTTNVSGQAIIPVVVKSSTTTGITP